jgi:hypothetical protein
MPLVLGQSQLARRHLRLVVLLQLAVNHLYGMPPGLR